MPRRVRLQLAWWPRTEPLILRADAGRAEQQLDAWVAQATDKAQRYERIQGEVVAVSVTESVAGGAVRVTVPSGAR